MVRLTAEPGAVEDGSRRRRPGAAGQRVSTSGKQREGRTERGVRGGDPGEQTGRHGANMAGWPHYPPPPAGFGVQDSQAP